MNSYNLTNQIQQIFENNSQQNISVFVLPKYDVDSTQSLFIRHGPTNISPPFITWWGLGRLGNWLSQYSNVRSVSLRFQMCLKMVDGEIDSSMLTAHSSFTQHNHPLLNCQISNNTFQGHGKIMNKRINEKCQ